MSENAAKSPSPPPDRALRHRVRFITAAALFDGHDAAIKLQENLPGSYPYTAGVYPFKRRAEAPRRQFAGEGGPQRTNQRLHYLCRNDRTRRLSIAFDSPTLYGEDPDPRPDIFGKIGEGGVSVATLDDMKALFAGFELSHPLTMMESVRVGGRYRRAM